MLVEELRLPEEPAEPVNVRCGRIKAKRKEKGMSELKTKGGAIRTRDGKTDFF